MIAFIRFLYKEKTKRRLFKLLFATLILILGIYLYPQPVKSFVKGVQEKTSLTKKLAKAPKATQKNNQDKSLKSTGETTEETSASSTDSSRDTLIQEKTFPEIVDKNLDTTLKNLAKETQIDVAIYSPTEGVYHYTNTTDKFHTASIVKVAVATEYYHLLEENKITKTVDDDTQMSYMLRESDNDATDYFVDDILKGETNLSPLFKSLAMTQTFPGESWGLTTTCALDQIKLLNALYYDDYLDEKDFSTVKSLMENVVSDQNWGISATDENTALKNGWLELEGEKWLVNSIGYIDSGRENYTMAILSKNNDTFSSGINLVETISQTVYNTITQEN